MNLRVLHCPSVVGGNPRALCRAQRQLGAASWSVTLEPNPFGYPVNEDLHTGRGSLRREFARWKMIVRALRDFDVIHYNFGRALGPRRARVSGKGARAPLAVVYDLLYAIPFEMCDARWAHRRGKIVAVTYQGDDARQGDVVRKLPLHFVQEVEADYYTIESDRNARRRIATFDRHADLIYALNPDLLAVLPPRAQFQAYCSVNANEWKCTSRPAAPPARPRLVHAPSHRGVKGTRHVVEAVRQLREGGVELDLVLVENMTHAEARRIYETADLAIDQVLAGFYGALAVEMMALEVPVVCYIRDEDLVRLPVAMRAELPLINATPATLVSVLRTWLVDRRGELRQRGRDSREFVKRWHDPAEIARATLLDYAAVWERRGNSNQVSRKLDQVSNRTRS